MQRASNCSSGLFLLVLILARPSAAVEPADVREQLMGNFRYLVETQVNCAASLKPGNYICNRDTPGERRVHGSWDSYLYPVAVRLPNQFRFVDSNLFFTVQTLLPLFAIRFEDPVLEQQRLDAIHLGMKAVNSFRRGHGYAFWPQVGPTRKSQLNRIGPLNLSPQLLGAQIEIISRIQDFFHVRLIPSSVRWIETYLDLDHAESGPDVLFNVPNDTDDTALAIAGNYYYLRSGDDPERLVATMQLSRQFAGRVDVLEKRNERRFKEHEPRCEEIWRAQTSDAARRALFADKDFLEGCSLDDARESWRYDSYPSRHSGAFLTWQYDENTAVYADPQQGVVLPGQNSVDCYAIANVVYSLSLTGMRDDPALRPGYENSCRAITNIILDSNNQLRMVDDSDADKITTKPLWKSCGLFFPAHMTYPYLVSRAIGDGGACQDLEPPDQERFDEAIDTLVASVVAEQDEDSNDKQPGQWFEEIDGQTALPTVLGGVSLLNFRKAYGSDLDRRYELKNRIEEAIAHTLAHSYSESSPSIEPLISVPEGTYFGGGNSDAIAHWRSQPFSTSVSLELMTKYLLQFGDESSHNEQLVLATELKPAAVTTAGHHSFGQADLSDALVPFDEASFRVRLRPGLKVGNEGTEVTLDTSLSVGEHFQGSLQEATENIAYYDVKVVTTAGFDFDSGELRNYAIKTGFHGISTTTSVIMQNDAAFLPLSFRKQDDVRTASAYLWGGGMSAAAIDLINGPRINLDVAGALVGAVEKSDDISGSTQKVTTINLAEFSIGLTWHWSNVSAGFDYSSSLGRAEDSSGGQYSSLKNYRWGTNITYRPRPNHSLSLVTTRTRDGESRDLFDDDQVYFQYRYEWASGT
jgi:hypothetical protein